MSQSSNTDWDTVIVLRKKAATGKSQKTQSAINEARRTGGVVAVEKKFSAGTNNKTGHGTDLNTAKLEREDEELSHKTVSLDVGKTIQKARQDKQMTQKDLAVKINEKPQIIQEYEQGKAIPNQQILGKLERVLGVKLRGKDIGTPLVRKGAAAK